MAPKAALRPIEIVRSATLVHGGGSKKEYPWIPAIEVIGDKEFISVDRSNREFARCIVCRRVVRAVLAQRGDRQRSRCKVSRLRHGVGQPDDGRRVGTSPRGVARRGGDHDHRTEKAEGTHTLFAHVLRLREPCSRSGMLGRRVRAVLAIGPAGRRYRVLQRTGYTAEQAVLPGSRPTVR